MKKYFSLLIPAILLLALCEARAVPFEPTFSDYSFSGSQYDVDAPANAFFSTNYGITVSNAYLYKDSRDTFDGIGIANGFVSEIGSPQTGRINFLDTTDFVSVDFIALNSTIFQSLDSDGNVLETFTITGEGTHLFNTSGAISALLWSSTGGYAGVSGLRYDYDGTTDGHNDDAQHVPEGGATLAMLGLATIGLTRFSRKFSRA